MKTKGLMRKLSLVLAVTLAMTSMPTIAYAEEMTEPAAFEVETVENTEDVVTTVASEEMTNTDADTSSEVSESETETVTLESTEESPVEEELELQEGGTIQLGDTDKSGTGWTWNTTTKTFTLDGANITDTVAIYSDAKIVVENDSRIAVASKQAIVLYGGEGQSVEFSGKGTLTLSTEANNTPVILMNNNGVTRNIAVKGSTFTLNCLANGGEEAIAVYNGTFTVTDEATVNAKVVKYTYAIGCSNGEINVENGGKLNTETEDGSGIYVRDDKSIVNITGKGSVLAANYTSDSRGSGAAIDLQKAATINVINGGKVVANNVIPYYCGVIYATWAKVDIRGGIIEAHAKTGKEFDRKSMIFAAKGQLQYDEEGLVDSYCDDKSSYDYDSIRMKGTSADFLYAKLLEFTSVPEAKRGIKTGETTTLSAVAETVNTDETPVISYQWYKDDVKIVGATASTYVTPALENGLYTYKCEASATFSVGEIKITSTDTIVSVTPSGKLYVDEILKIDSTTESVDKLTEEGWAWDKAEGKLYFDDAFLKQVEIKDVTATIVNSGNTIITSPDQNAIRYYGTATGLNITGSGTLTLTNEGKTGNSEVISGGNKDNGTITISGSGLTVNCNSPKGTGSAIIVYDKFVLTNGAILNIDSNNGTSFYAVDGAEIVIDGGAKFNSTTANDGSAVKFGQNVILTVSGTDTVATFDSHDEKTTNYTFSLPAGCKININEHAKMIINNTKDNSYPVIDSISGEVNMMGGILEVNAPAGKKFPANKKLIRTEENGLFYNKYGISNGEVNTYGGNDHLTFNTETAKWLYIGDKPYINFVKQPVNKNIKNSNTATLEVEAEAVYAETTPEIHYQWYKDGVLISGATSATYTTEELTDIIIEYYCVASATVKGDDIEEKTNTVIVSANASGNAIRTEPLRLNDSKQESEVNEEEGWSWDKENKILTLDNFTMRTNAGSYGISLPLGCTIVLNGNNRIDMLSSNYAIYAWNESGNVIIRGEGTLDTSCISRYGIYTKENLEILGELEVGTQHLDNPITGETSVIPDYNSVKNVYETRIVTAGEPALLFTRNPENKVYTTSVGGVAPKLTVGAELYGATGAVNYQYQWYATDNWYVPTDGAVALTKGATLTAPVKERGGKYYYCEVTATYNKKQYKKISDIYTVVVGQRGLTPLTERTYLGSSSVDHMADQGWSYDADTCTLTFNNLEAFIPYATNSDTYELFIISKTAEEMKVVLADGSVNHITDCCRGLCCSDGKVLTITGNGVLNYEAGPASCQGLLDLSETFTDLKINGGAKVKSVGGWNVILNPDINITVDNAEASIESLVNYTYGKNCTIHVKDGGTLSLLDSNDKYAKDVQIDKGGALYIASNGTGLTIDEEAGTGTLTVEGILSIATKYTALKIYGANPEDRIIIKDSVIKVPEAETISELNTLSKPEYSTYCEGNLIIAPKDFTRIPISGIPVVTGEMKVGSTVTAGDVAPEGATVAYQWQHAVSKDSPDEFWEDFGYEDRSLSIDERYVDEYIRIKITGTGKYTGTVYSKPTEPVAANSVTVADFVVDKSAHYGRLSPLTVNYIYGYYYQPNIKTDEVYVKVVADDKNSKITIKNITTDFDTKTDAEKTINGPEGYMPLCDKGGSYTNNKIEITVTNGKEKAVYIANIDYRFTTGAVNLHAGDHTTITLTDDEHNVILKADRLKKYAYADLSASAEYLLTAKTDLDGWYVASIGNEDYQNDSMLVNGERLVHIKVPNQNSLSFTVADNELRCAAPEVEAHWAANSAGFGIEATWVDPVPAIYKETGYTGRVSAVLFDEDGNEIRLREASTDNSQGFYTYFGDSGYINALDESGNVISLDPGKSYVIKLWYDAGEKEKCDMQEIVIPAMDLSMNEHHIVVEKPTGTDPYVTTVDVKGRAFKTEIFPNTVTFEQMTVDPAYEGGYVTVTVTKEAKVGSAYALIYAKRPDGTVVSEVLTIDVVEPAGTVTAGLTDITGSMNIYSSDRLLVPVNIIGSGKPIVGAKFVEANNEVLTNNYLIQSAGNRTLEIVPVYVPDTKETDWAKVAKSYTGTFKGKIEVELEDGTKYITKDYYTLKVTAKAPKVTATAIKLNSFYEDDQATIIYKSDSKITEARIDEVKKTSKTPACPDWVYLIDSGKKVIVDNNKLINNKGTGKICLKVWVDGYRMPAQISVPVSVAYTMPKIKLAASTITLPANNSRYYRYAEISVVSNDKKIAFEDLDITDVRVASPEEVAELGDKDKKAYAASNYYKAYSYDVETGVMKLALKASPSQLPAGKILLIAEVGGNSKQRIELPLTIKTEIDSKITLKMSQKAITLNSNKESGSEKIRVTLIPSSMGYKYDDVKITVTDTKGKGDYKEKLDIERSIYDYTFSTNSKTEDGTYRVNIAIPGVTKPATIDVTVKGSIPNLKADKASVNIDSYGDYLGHKKQTVILSLSDSTIKPYSGNCIYRIYDSKKASADGELNISYSTYEGNKIVATIGTNSMTKLGKYNVELIYKMPGSGVESIAKVVVNVKEKLPTIKASSSNVTLNSFLGKSDVATVTFTRPEGYEYSTVTTTVQDKTGTTVDNVIACNYDKLTGVLTMHPDVKAVAGQTYKVNINQLVLGEVNNTFVVNTINVKMVAAAKSTGKAAITQKVVTKGTLDITRVDSALQVIPSYTGWSGIAAEDAIDPPMAIWAVYAYDSKGKPYQHSNPEYQYQFENGLVAISTASGTTDWFVDTDPTDAISLGFNYENKFINEVSDLTSLTFKIVYTTAFDDYLGADDLILESTATFKVKNGTIKLSVPSPNKVILNRYDKYDSKIVKVELTDIDASALDIREVKMKDGSSFDATLLYVGGDYAYIAIGWADDSVPINIKQGPQTIEFYSGYNYIGRTKCNGTASVTITVQ